MFAIQKVDTKMVKSVWLIIIEVAKRRSMMAREKLNPLQKEALILEFRQKEMPMHEFCESHEVLSPCSFQVIST